MKISCLRSDLQTAISNVSRAVSSKSTIPALEGVLVKAYGDKLNISGYNLEIGITTDIEATIKEEGEIVISARLFFDIVRNLPEEILTIETDDRLVIYIQCGAADYKITGMSSVEYPDLPAFEQTDGITLSSKTLREMIRQTVYAVSENTAKPIYTGSLYEIENSVLTIVAIDGYRMAVRRENVTSDSETSFIVPGKTQLEILKLLSDDEEPVDIIIGQRHITFKVKNYRVISRLIEGIFIDYKTTIPSVAKTEVVINVKRLTNSVERMSLMNNERMQSSASDTIGVTVAGDNVEIGFNNRYMLDALKNVDTDEVKLELNGPISPIVIKPVQGDNFVSIVVPMRLANEG